VPTVTIDDVARMRDAVFFEGEDASTRLSRFWILLILAAIIAAAGVVGDSTATVIGAMIVAPLMTPILGTMLAITLADRDNVLRSVALVLLGAVAAIAVGYLLGLLVSNPVVAATSSQVASRVHPRLIDLVAALATGVVGSVALVRRDISDTLPGVAIAISLVPPLSVVGLAAESGAWGQAGGALLLFGTNVAAILASGTLVMALYRVYGTASQSFPANRRSISRRKGFAVIIAMVAALLVVLAISSIAIARDTRTEAAIRRVATAWADQHGYELLDVTTGAREVDVRFAGAPPLPETDDLAVALRAEGIDTSAVVVDLIPQSTISLGSPGG